MSSNARPGNRDDSWAGRHRLLSRRRLLRQAASGGIGLAGAGLMACSRTTKPGGPATSTSGQTAGKPQPGGVLNSTVSSNVVLDPQALSQVATDLVASGVLSRLFRFKTSSDPNEINNHDVEPDLALSAESPDAVTWTFKLRPNAKFQNIPPVNGHAVEAEDIKATILRAVSLPKNPNRGALAMIDTSQIQTPSPDTIVFKLNYPYAPFQKTMASSIYSWIFPREALAGSYDPAKQAIGSGPFTLESATPDVAYVLKKNPNWFEQGQPYVDGVNLAVINNTAQLLAQFSTGHLDEVPFGPNDLDTMKRQNPRAALIRTLPTSIGTGFFPLGDPSSPFQDIRIRQGLSMAIDYDAIARSVFGGEIVRSLFVAPSLGKWSLTLNQLDPSVAQYYKYNPSEAKKLLEAAGATNMTLKIAIITTGVSTAQSWYPPEASAVYNMFQSVGMKLEQVPIDFTKDFLDAGKGYRQGYFDKDVLFFFNAQTFSDIDEQVYNYFDSKSTQSGERLQDSTLDNMISKARTIVDDNQRLQAYLDIQKYMASKVYTLVVGGGYNYMMVQPRVQNYNVSESRNEGAETYPKLWLNA